MQNRLFIFGEPIDRSPGASGEGRPMVGFRCEQCGLSAYAPVPEGVEVKEDLMYLTGVIAESDKLGLEDFVMEHESAGHGVSAMLVGAGTLAP
jgi:hypothetical protein